MLVRDLTLPNGDIVQFHTGKVISREPSTTDMPWSELSAGPGITRVDRNSSQPFVGCQTGGDLVAEVLMNHLVNK